MTTLPKTVTVRPPQAPASPAPALYSNSATAAAAFQMTPADVWRVLRANMWLVFLFLVGFGGLGFGVNWYWAKNWPRYTATGMLKIQTRHVLDPINDKTLDVTDTRLVTLQRTQASMLADETLFSQVLKDPNSNIRNTQWFRYHQQKDSSLRKAKEDLQDHFRVTPVAESELVLASMTWSNPEDCKIIVEELVNAHLKEQLEQASVQVNEQHQMLRQMLTSVKTDLQIVANRVRNAQETLTEKGLGGDLFFSAKEEELRALVTRMLEAEKEANEQTELYQRAASMAEKGERLPEVEQAIEADPTIAMLNRDLLGTLIAHDVKKDIFGGEHKEVVILAKQIELYQQRLEQRRQELRTTYTTQYVERSKGLATMKLGEKQSLEKRVDELKKQLVSLGKEMSQLRLDREEEKSLRELQQTISNKLTDISVTQTPQKLAVIDWARRPETPDIPSWPKLKIMMPLSVTLGLMLALGIAFLREALDDTVRSPRDVSRVGQVNLLGIIADEVDDPQAASAKLAIFDAPQSLTAEQFRQVRTRLQHAANLDTIRSIMVTGPGPMDGKTTVAANLASGLALNGRRILLVDANFRRPELHRLFGVPNERGFSDAITNTVTIEELVHSTRIPNLAILTSGGKPANATELFESQFLIDFIERALESYDHVIFDSAPFLVVSESTAMAPRVDGVITVVRAHNESRGMLQRMRELLRQVKAEHLGVVLNAVRAQGGGYYRRTIKTYYNYSNYIHEP